MRIKRRRKIYLWLCALGGVFGLHLFWTHQPKKGWIYLICTLLLYVSPFPFMIILFAVANDFETHYDMPNKEFYAKYNSLFS